MTSDKRLRILYFLYIPWNWVRARPQYMAEALRDQGFHVTVVSPLVWRREVLTDGEAFDGLQVHYRFLPFRFRLRFIYAANRLLLRIWFAFIVRRVQHDVLWIPFPELMDYLPPDLDGLVVYDCMDDALAFGQLAMVRKRLSILESKTVDRADVVFVSSQSLAEKIRERTHTAGKTVLVHNAFGGAVLPRAGMTGPMTAEQIRIGYVGNLVTLDHDAIWTTLRELPDIAYDMIGPMEVDMSTWQNPRVTFHGLVAHDELVRAVKDDQCLVMPYVTNERVLSADSMKLYDYVNLGKPIVSVWYPEIERFRPFVEFYKTPDELVVVLRELIVKGFPRKYTEEQRIAFLTENSWAERAKVVEDVLQGLIMSTAPSRGRHE